MVEIIAGDGCIYSKHTDMPEGATVAMLTSDSRLSLVSMVEDMKFIGWRLHDGLTVHDGTYMQWMVK